MIGYAVYTIYKENSRTAVFNFEDTWRYSNGEKIFYHDGDNKRLFVINHITHDVDSEGNSLHRLYCQEKKAF